MTSRDRDRDRILISGPRGRLFTARLSPKSVYFYFEGHIDLAVWEPSMVVANDIVRSGGAELYGDGGNWKTYAAGYREAWTKWFLEHRARLAKTYLVTASPLLRMGVQVVNLFVPNAITALSQTADLYRTLHEKHPRARDLVADWPADIAARFCAPTAQRRAAG